MKKAIQSLWAELGKAQKPAKLSKQGKQVKLSVVDDLENLYNQLEEQTSLASYFAQEWVDEAEGKVIDAIDGLDDYLINSSMRYLADTGKEALESLNKLEDNAKALGIDPEEIYPDFKELRDWAENAEDMQYEAYNALTSSLLKDLTGFANDLRP
jgi:hypothetical protein